MLYLYRKIVVFYTTKALENGLKYCINYLYTKKPPLVVYKRGDGFLARQHFYNLVHFYYIIATGYI